MEEFVFSSHGVSHTGKLFLCGGAEQRYARMPQLRVHQLRVAQLPVSYLSPGIASSLKAPTLPLGLATSVFDNAVRKRHSHIALF